MVSSVLYTGAFGYVCCAHFTDEETGVQTWDVICLRSPSEQVGKQGLEPTLFVVTHHAPLRMLNSSVCSYLRHSGPRWPHHVHLALGVKVGTEQGAQ